MATEWTVSLCPPLKEQVMAGAVPVGDSGPYTIWA